jgi:hypothetical protein
MKRIALRNVDSQERREGPPDAIMPKREIKATFDGVFCVSFQQED